MPQYQDPNMPFVADRTQLPIHEPEYSDVLAHIKKWNGANALFHINLLLFSCFSSFLFRKNSLIFLQTLFGFRAFLALKDIPLDYICD